MSTTQPVADLGYEKARDELVEVVRALESGSATLENSLRLWERGEALAARCQQILDGARERLDQVTSRGGHQADGQSGGTRPHPRAGGQRGEPGPDGSEADGADSGVDGEPEA